MINIRIVLFLLGITLSLFLLLRYQGRLETPASPLGIVSLEFARTKSAVTEIRDAWSSEGLIDRARTNIWIDFLFIPFYAMLFYTLCGSISVRMKDMTAKAGVFLAFGALVAGLFDVLENILMLFALGGQYNTVTASVKALLAGGKFLFLALALLYVIPLGFRIIAAKLSGYLKPGGGQAGP
jgi:hypothetical protein